MAAATYDTLLPNYPALHNLSFSSLQPEYEPVFARYGYDPQAVAALMLGHGCVRGADGIWSCAGTRASVKFATTSGNAQRELVQQQMVAQARSAGIELVLDNSSAGELFGTRLPARQYELIMFTWLFGGGLPTVRQLYGCNGENNFMGYCSPAVTDLGLRIEAEVDPVVRAQQVNEANRIIAEDVPSLPLFLRLALLVRNERLQGRRSTPADTRHGTSKTWRLETDEAAPETTATASPVANANGWNNGPVTVALAATDDDSGVQKISYSLSGAQTGGAVVAGNQATVTVSAHGITTLTYFATDVSGNVEPVKTLTIRIDKAEPALACAAVPARVWPPNGQLERVRIVAGLRRQPLRDGRVQARPRLEQRTWCRRHPGLRRRDAGHHGFVRASALPRATEGSTRSSTRGRTAPATSRRAPLRSRCRGNAESRMTGRAVRRAPGPAVSGSVIRRWTRSTMSS